MPAGPLDDARLRIIEECLNGGRLDEAQRRLAELGAVRELDAGIAYLSARLLFHRGRLDANSIASRLRDVLSQRPDFVEAQGLLETVLRSDAVTAPPPKQLETPRIPEPESPTLARSPSPSLGRLELPRSEQPTEPAPPPEGGATAESPRLGTPGASRSLWDPLEAELVSGRRDAVVAGLDQLAARSLDVLLQRQNPKLSELAREVAAFLVRAPVSRHFAPYDFSLESLDRLDAVLALLVPPGLPAGQYALRVFLSVYAGECVRQASGTRWEGSLVEPEGLTIRRDPTPYVPWQHVADALGKGQSLRRHAGPPPHPGAEPPEETMTLDVDGPTPWDPEPWPSLEVARQLTRALPASVLGVWAARCLKIPLDRTPASLLALDRYVALLAPRYPLSGPFRSWVRSAAVLSGSYFGEVLCLQAAGRFDENDAARGGALRFQVLLPQGRVVHPVLFAYHRLIGREHETFTKLYQSSIAG